MVRENHMMHSRAGGKQSKFSGFSRNNCFEEYFLQKRAYSDKICQREKTRMSSPEQTDTCL